MPVSGAEVLQQVGVEDVSFGTGLDTDGKTKVNASHLGFLADNAKKVEQLFNGTTINSQCATPTSNTHSANKKYVDDQIASGVAGSILGNSEGLAVSRTNVTTVSIDFSRVQVTNSGGQGIILPAPATPYSAVITTSGAGGLDTGAEAVSSWYYLYMIFDESGTNAINTLLSLSPTTPTMPSGYTHKTLLSAVYNDTAGNFIAFHQIDRDYAYDVARELAVLYTGNGSDDLTNFIPDVMFKGVNGRFGSGGVSGVQLGLSHVAITVGTTEAVYYFAIDPKDINTAGYSSFQLDVLVTRTLFYADAVLTGKIYVTGFTIRS